MKVLIIQQKMIGDVLTSSILFEAIKKKYPAAELHYLINSHTLPIVENHPYIDKFQLLTPEIEASKFELYSFLKSIQIEQYDVVVDVYGKVESALISLFSKAKIKTAYYKKYSAFLYSHPVKRINIPKNNSSLAIENRMKLLECMDIPFEEYHPNIYLKEAEIEAAKNYLEIESIFLNRPLYMISVLGSSKIKSYPPHYMAQLLDEIVKLKPNSQLLFNYIPKQVIDAREIYNYCLPETQKQIYFEVFGKSLREFLAITHHCTAFLGNEGGANNMAKALGIPTFTIFSPYLNKKNWFGKNEEHKHYAVHISDYLPFSEQDVLVAKKHPKEYYLKFKPEYIISDLKRFMNTID